MKTFSIKLALSALAVAALATSPALAAKRVHQVSQDQDAVQQNYAGYYNSASPENGMAGYDSEGGVVSIPNPDQYR